MVAAPVSLDTLCINSIRMLAVDAVNKSNSGHPGLPMGCAPMGYTLWDKFPSTTPRTPSGSTATVSCSQQATAACCFMPCCT